MFRFSLYLRYKKERNMETVVSNIPNSAQYLIIDQMSWDEFVESSYFDDIVAGYQRSGFISRIERIKERSSNVYIVKRKDPGYDDRIHVLYRLRTDDGLMLINEFSAITAMTDRPFMEVISFAFSGDVIDKKEVMVMGNLSEDDYNTITILKDRAFKRTAEARKFLAANLKYSTFTTNIWF